MPAQLSLLPAAEPSAEVIASLRMWPDRDLMHLVRAAACELIRRDLPLPAAVPIVEAGYAAVGGMSAIADGCESR